MPVMRQPDFRAVRVAQSVVTAMHEIAVREAFPSLSGPHFAAMRRANTRLADALRADDVDAAIAADDQFHGITVAASGSAALRTVLEEFTPLLRQVERLRFASPARCDSVIQHDRVIELCEAGDVDAAAAAAARANWQTLAPLLAHLGGRP